MVIASLLLAAATFLQIYIGWTSEDAPDEAQLKAIGDGMSDRIFGVHGKYYTSQKGIGLYPTSGTARDWYVFETICTWMIYQLQVLFR